MKEVNLTGGQCKFLPKAELKIAMVFHTALPCHVVASKNDQSLGGGSAQWPIACVYPFPSMEDPNSN